MSRNYKEKKRLFPFGLSRELIANVHGVITRVRMAWETVAFVLVLSFILAVCLSGKVTPFMEGTVWARLWSPAFGWVAAAGIVLIVAGELGSRLGWDDRAEWLLWMIFTSIAAALAYAIIFRGLWAAVLLAIWTVVSFFILDEEASEVVISFLFDR